SLKKRQMKQRRRFDKYALFAPSSPFPLEDIDKVCAYLLINRNLYIQILIYINISIGIFFIWMGIRTLARRRRRTYVTTLCGKHFISSYKSKWRRRINDGRSIRNNDSDITIKQVTTKTSYVVFRRNRSFSWSILP